MIMMRQIVKEVYVVENYFYKQIIEVSPWWGDNMIIIIYNDRIRNMRTKWYRNYILKKLSDKKSYKKELYYKINKCEGDFMMRKLDDEVIISYESYIERRLHNKTAW